MQLRLTWTALTGAALLAGCASAPQRRPVSPPSRQPVVVVVPRPDASGEDASVIGRTAAALTAMLGAPALDVREGSARKLQFLNGQCVLDAYLYPPRESGEPVAVHVDARAAADGRDFDHAACIAALRRR